MAQNYTPIDHLLQKWETGRIAHPSHASSKEGEPIRMQENIAIEEAVEHEPESEVKPFVQIKPETIKLPPDLKTLGLQPASQSSFPSYKNVKIPLADDKVIPGRHAPITSSLRWLAELSWYILRMAHLTLKTVRGHAVRVIKR